MPLETSLRISQELSKTNIEPRLVLCIDGLEECLTSGNVKELIRIGDDGLFIDGTWNIGGTRDVASQQPLISFKGGTTTTLSQQIRHDKGQVNSVQNVSIRLVDKNEFASQLISPGVKIPEILGTRAELLIGFGDAPLEEYFKIFSGRVVSTASGAGFVIMKMNHTDEAKRQPVFDNFKTELSSAMNSSQTTLSYVAGTGGADFLLPGDDIRTFVRVNDEFMEYTGKTSNTLTGLTRGALTVDGGTAPAAHDAEDNIESVYMFEGNPIELALKIMLSGGPDPYESAVAMTNFVTIEPVEEIIGAIWFETRDIAEEIGVVAGDSVTVTGASNGANNGTFTITDIISNNFGSYILTDNASMVVENNSTAELSFSSQFNVLPTGFGLGMKPIEVDILQHLDLLNGFLASAPDVRLILDEPLTGFELIDEQLYRPVSAYSIPRKSKSSLGAYRPPLSDEELVILDESNIVRPSTMRIERGTTQNYFSKVLFNYDKSVLDSEFKSVRTRTAGTIDRDKVFTLNADGYRSDLGGEAAAINVANRILKRYTDGAEYIKGLRVTFDVGILLEPGDIVLIDFTNLFVTNIQDGTRNKPANLYEIENRTINLANGTVQLDLVDTAFSEEFRYARISPSSYIKSGINTQEFIIEPSFSKPFANDEWKKWSPLIGSTVKVFSQDFSQSDDAVLSDLQGNRVILKTALSFTPSAGQVMTLSEYTGQPSLAKTKYVFMTDGTNDFPDGGAIYVFI